MIIAGALLSLVAVLLFLPVIVLLGEIMCALVAANGKSPSEIFRPANIRVAVLIPAHDEEDGIGAMVSEVAKQLGSADRLIVVADNCTDGTGEEARAPGAEVIERRDPKRRGKGYALDFGVRHLEGDPPDILVIVDADCRFGQGSINALVACIERTGRPAQAFNEVLLPANTDAKRRVAGFAWIVKNHVRPAGLSVLGLPCQLMGTGMAFPWGAIRRIDLATGNIVEDVKMGLDLAVAGFPPIFCPEARVESDFPATELGFLVQRQRWETGSLLTVVKIVPVMIVRALVTFNVPLLVMAADLMVPPLMMLMAALLVGLTVSTIFALAGGTKLPTAIFGASLIALMVSLTIAWFHFAREVLLPRDILALPGVFLQKFVGYLAMWRGRGRGWIRTDRK